MPSARSRATAPNGVEVHSQPLPMRSATPHALLPAGCASTGSGSKRAKSKLPCSSPGGSAPHGKARSLAAGRAERGAMVLRFGRQAACRPIARTLRPADALRRPATRAAAESPRTGRADAIPVALVSRTCGTGPPSRNEAHPVAVGDGMCARYRKPAPSISVRRNSLSQPKEDLVRLDAQASRCPQRRFEALASESHGLRAAR